MAEILSSGDESILSEGSDGVADKLKQRVNRRRLRVEKIIGLVNGATISVIVKWKGVDRFERIALSDMKRLYPTEILDYMFQRIKWIDHKHPTSSSTMTTTPVTSTRTTTPATTARTCTPTTTTRTSTPTTTTRTSTPTTTTRTSTPSTPTPSITTTTTYETCTPTPATPIRTRTPNTSRATTPASSTKATTPTSTRATTPGTSTRVTRQSTQVAPVITIIDLTESD